MRKITAFLICLLFLTNMFSFSAAAGNTSLVIMVYMTGSDLESSGGAASADLEEMMQFIPENGGIRVIAMISGSNKWKNDIPADETSVYEVTRNGLVCVQKNPSKSMGSPETLTSFLAFTESEYPSGQYGLILWDHGAGPLGGICFDETFKEGNEMDRLSLDELAAALSASPFAHKDLLFAGFDACLMSTLEVAVTLAPYAGYMIASQETEPVSGWNYAFLSALSGTESGDEIGREIVTAYEESLKDSSRPVTLSCLDLHETGRVCTALGAFFSDIEPRVSNESYPVYTKCRSISKTLGNTTTTAYDLVDLLDLISLYQTDNLADGAALTEALHSMVVCHFAAHDDFVNGISIYYPFDNKAMYEARWASAYSRLGFIPEYQSFIKRISDIFMGEALLSWKSSYQVQLQETAGTVRLTMDFTPDEMNNISRSRLIVVEELQDGVYQQVYVDYNTLRQGNSAISSTYHGEALYVVDGNGEILTGPVTYYPADNGIAVLGLVEYDFDPTLPFGSQKTQDVIRLIYHQEDDGSLSLTDIMLVEDNEAKLSLPAALDLTSVLSLTLINSGPSQGYESIPSLSGYGMLPNSISLDPAEGAPRLAFLPVYGSNNRYAYIRITDMQGQTTLSDVVQIPNPTLIPLASEQTFEDNSRLLLSLKSADMVSGYNSGVKCVLHMKNRAEEPCKVSVMGVSFDSAPVSEYTSYRMSFVPDEEDEIMVFISGRAISAANLEEAKSINISLGVTYEGKQPELLDVSIPVQLNTAIFSLAK